MGEEKVKFGQAAVEKDEDREKLAELLDDELALTEMSAWEYDFVMAMADRSGSLTSNMREQIRKLYQDTYSDLTPKQN